MAPTCGWLIRSTRGSRGGTIGKWDERLEVLKLLTPDQFVEALKTNLTGSWLLRFLARNMLHNPRALAEASGIL